MKSKRLFTAIIALGMAGFSLPPAHGQTQSLQKTTATTQAKPIRRTFTPVKVSETELKIFTQSLPVIGTISTQSNINVQQSVVNLLDVPSPANNDIWEAGREYVINWSRANYDVKIDMLSISSDGKSSIRYPITGRSPNTGTFRFKVPYNWVRGSQGRVQIETLDGKQSGSSLGTVNVYTQPVDLECRIVDSNLKSEKKDYLFYAESKRWLEFNLLIRNKGVQSPVTIQNVLVRIIKEPENVVVTQEEWGYSGIYDHNWYRLPEPRKFDIMSSEYTWPWFRDKNVNLESGSYRVEVQLDPQNRLGEIQECRYDNMASQDWIIR